MFKSLLFRLYAAWRDRQSIRIPYREIQEKHIRQLKTVPDRLALLACLPANAVVAEVGVCNGEFSRHILEITHPVQLHLIDTWEGKEGRKNLETLRARFASDIAAGRVILHRGNSLDELDGFQPQTFDWIYIDTDHSYPTTAKELVLSAKALKTNGIIAGHDYVTGNWRRGIRYGVVEAVNEFCLMNGWEMIFLTAETHRHLSFAISKLQDG